jgi:hypothetical protein
LSLLFVTNSTATSSERFRIAALFLANEMACFLLFLHLAAHQALSDDFTSQQAASSEIVYDAGFLLGVLSSLIMVSQLPIPMLLPLTQVTVRFLCAHYFWTLPCLSFAFPSCSPFPPLSPSITHTERD